MGALNPIKSHCPHTETRPRLVPSIDFSVSLSRRSVRDVDDRTVEGKLASRCFSLIRLLLLVAQGSLCDRYKT